MAAVITYIVTNGDFPITVTLASALDPNTIIATNIHNAFGTYTFSGIPDGDYILTFSDARGCTINVEACDLTPSLNVVYNCDFSFTMDLSQIPSSPTPTPTVTPTITKTATPTISRTITPTPTPTRTSSVTRTPTPTTSVSPTPAITSSVTPTPSRTITPSRTVTKSITPTVTPTKTPTASMGASRTPTPTKTMTPTRTLTPTPSLQMPQLKITSVIALCSYNSVLVTISGGTSPYQYSVDNGVTLSPPTANTSYEWASLSGGIYNVYVIDSLGIVYLWPEINCNDLEVTFIPIYLTNTASGGLFFGSGPVYDYPHHVFGQPSDSFNVEADVVGLTIFTGYSYELANRFTVDGIHMITTLTGLTYTFPSGTEPIDVIIYGYFTDNGPISLDLCFTSGATPSTITDTDRAYVCTTCNTGTTVTVYFDTAAYLANGIENVTWFSDDTLTTPVTDGYYIDSSGSFSVIYGVASGDPINLGTCGGGEEIICT